MASIVRTRFAPSPTGFMHLGNARTALFAYLYARHCRGRFLLRIEDTDQERLVEGAEAAIYRDLKWLGLEWDEGPDIGGPVGPYRCSERYHLYEDHIKRIRKNARVYRCFCSPEQLDQDRKLLSSQNKVIKYVGRCLSIAEADSESRAKSEKFVWRMHVPEGGEPISINDVVRGEVKMIPDIIGDFIISRSTGIPVFLFANAVDDAVMEITHVTRGEDHLSNTFRQVLIYRALGYAEPIFAHLPMIGDTDGGKFSKRAGSLSIENLRDEGFIADGILNYLALLGWSPGDTSETDEKFKKEELIERFDLDRVHKSRALFDYNKLRFLNQAHLQNRTPEDLAELVPPTNSKWLPIWKDAVALIQHDISTLNEIHKIESFLEQPDFSSSSMAADVLRTDQNRKIISQGLISIREKVSSGSSIEEALKDGIKKVGKDLSVKGRELYFPFRMALTGRDAGPELNPLAKLIGAEAVVSRLERAVEFGSQTN